jgi:hypothetical protein
LISQQFRMINFDRNWVRTVFYRQQRSQLAKVMFFISGLGNCTFYFLFVYILMNILSSFKKSIEN